MIVLKSEKDLAEMRPSCRLAAGVLGKVADAVVPGVTTGELDAYAAELIRDAGATSAFLGYRGYPGTICISISEEVVHGIPGKRQVRIGDAVSIDVGVRLGGYVGDCARTVLVGVTDPELIRLAAVAGESLAAGIGMAKAGGRLSDISHAIEKAVLAGGFSVVRQFVGHGIGRQMHEDPQVPNFGVPGRGPRLKAGMTLAIEPMVNMGSHDVEVMEDGWTVRTVDRLPSVHVEHTIAIGEGEAEILTQ